MSGQFIITVAIEHEMDVVAVRQRARRIADLLGFETHDQTRIATATSEIARNALMHAGGGRADFALAGDPPTRRLVVTVVDSGPGIADVAAALQGRVSGAAGGKGRGLVGARRLMEGFDIATDVRSGTTVTLDKALPDGVAGDDATAARIARILADETAGDPLVEIRAQNAELLRSLAELTTRQEESARLNGELEDTNRGVVALYAELDQRAAELRDINAGLEARIAAALAERAALEEGLRQSQKMEAVGQLTGGIAHDFNNLLQIVTGNLDILDRALPADADRLRRAARNAMGGARRAAILTQRLLAFSRRQPLAPEPIDVNRLVAGMSDLLSRTLGEPIAIETVLADGLWPTEADPNQLENALINLAVNARDAMPGGGTLTIETSNAHLDEAYARDNAEVAPGPYTAIRVTDTGSGMSADTLSRVFEPFFTTKDVGQGTGLGLSMVYGFVKQSNGHVKLRSDEGRGTTVDIYLPRLRRAAIVPEPGPVEQPVVPEGNGEDVILVVEDDEGVRAYSTEVLRELGYRVVEAADGVSGLSALAAQPRVDLLFTDVVLPGGMSGRELADAAGARVPGLKVLFTTGYARDAIVHHGRLDADVRMIGKPFTFAELAARVREVLDGR